MPTLSDRQIARSPAPALLSAIDGRPVVTAATPGFPSGASDVGREGALDPVYAKGMMAIIALRLPMGCRE